MEYSSSTSEDSFSLLESWLRPDGDMIDGKQSKNQNAGMELVEQESEMML